MAEATVPFQPTYSLTPKYGLRYGPSQFTASTGIPGVGSATSQSVNQPASLGAGASVVDPFANSTQFQQAQANYSGQGGVSSTSSYGAPIQSRGVTGSNTGFRSNSYTYEAPPSIPTVPDYFNPTPTTPVVKDPFAGDPAFSQGDDGQSNSTPDYSNVASGLGYTRSPASLTGLAGMIPYVGPMIAGSMESNYGKPGTYDAQGNVFGDEGRAYNPLTGAPVASYANRETALNTVTGGYDKLREAGANPIASALGSYENSINNVSREDRLQGYTPSGKAGYNSAVDIARLNQGLEADDVTKLDPSYFGSNRLGLPTSTTSMVGTGQGDIFNTVNGQAGIITDSGQISTPEGTMVQTTDAQGNAISLLGTPEENKANLDYLDQTKNDFQSDTGGFGAGGDTSYGDQVKAEKAVSIDEFGGAGDSDSGGGK